MWNLFGSGRRMVKDAGKKELIAMYTAMMQTDGWKHLVDFAEKEREQSMKRMDSKPAADLSLGEVCEERGIRKGIFKIIQHAEFCRDGV
jgi:hypothetical protein